MINFSYPAAELTGYYGKTSAERADHMQIVYLFAKVNILPNQIKLKLTLLP